MACGSLDLQILLNHILFLFVLRLDSEEKHVPASDFSLALAFGMILIVLSMVVSAVLFQLGTQRKLMDLFWAWREKHFLPINLV